MTQQRITASAKVPDLQNPKLTDSVTTELQASELRYFGTLSLPVRDSPLHRVILELGVDRRGLDVRVPEVLGDRLQILRLAVQARARRVTQRMHPKVIDARPSAQATQRGSSALRGELHEPLVIRAFQPLDRLTRLVAEVHRAPLVAFALAHRQRPINEIHVAALERADLRHPQSRVRPEQHEQAVSRLRVLEQTIQRALCIGVTLVFGGLGVGRQTHVLERVGARRSRPAQRGEEGFGGGHPSAHRAGLDPQRRVRRAGATLERCARSGVPSGGAGW